MSQTTRRGFLACLTGLAAFILGPVRLLSAKQRSVSPPMPEVRYPQVKPFRAMVNGEMFNLHRIGWTGASDQDNRRNLAEAAAMRFGQPGWRELRFSQRLIRGGAVVPSYIWC